MIITQTPLRLAIGGGGTDLPSYYSRYGGFFISAAIDKYIFIGLQRTFTKEIVLKYSDTERVQSIDEIKHHIVRAALASFDLTNGFEVASFADIPSGTGLGSSGSFTVGLLKGLSALDNKVIDAGQLADDASHLLMNTLKRPDGKQDQYVASYGGVNCYSVDTNGKVMVEHLKIAHRTLDALRDNLALFFTGFYRQSDNNLNIQKDRTERGDKEVVDGLHRVKELGFRIREALESDQPDVFGKAMHEHWEHKKKRSSSMSNSLIDSWYATALANGALGGKVIGAGGGGFLLFYSADKKRLIDALSKLGLRHVRFDFDFEGSKLIASV